MRQDRIMLAHGSGGTMMRQLIEDVFVKHFGDEALLKMDDSASLPAPTGRIAMSTDTYVVSPLFFPGADIGRLAICGTVNDIATSGATPMYISVGFVLEEGLEVTDLDRILESMAASAAEAGVRIVTGDTKVVEKGHGDGVYINTAGVGFLADGVQLSGAFCEPGDAILLSGTLGDHGIAVISKREGLTFGTDIVSDAAPLNALCAAVLAAAPDVRCFRDPTRGGLASTLNELAESSAVSMTVDEESVPVHDQVRGASEMLGYDVYQIANEGKMVAVVPESQAASALAAMKAAPYGADAAIIGCVDAEPAGKVYVRTSFGAKRIMDMLVGEQLPPDLLIGPALMPDERPTDAPEESPELKAALDQGELSDLPPNVPPGLLGEVNPDLRKVDPDSHGLNAGLTTEVDAPVVLLLVVLAYFVFFPAAYYVLWRSDKLPRRTKVVMSVVMAAGVVVAAAYLFVRSRA